MILANAGVNIPTSVIIPNGVESFTTVSTNTEFSCAIANNGKVYCWGTGIYAQIGNGASTNVNVPTSVVMPSGVESFSALSTNSKFTCAIANNGKIYCWGIGANGRIGNGTNNDVNVPTSVTMPNGVESFTAISTNANFSCAIANTGTIYCWGKGTSGQIGNGVNSNVNVPTAVTMPSGVTSFGYISTNTSFSCAIAASGDNAGNTYCWGYGSDGQIGNGANNNVNVPTLVQ